MQTTSDMAWDIPKGTSETKTSGNINIERGSVTNDNASEGGGEGNSIQLWIITHLQVVL